MLSTMSEIWIGGSGNWVDAADWSGDVVPNSDYDVTIPAGASVTISTSDELGDPEGASANSITTAAGSTLTITSKGSLDAVNGGTINGAFNLLNGTIIGNGNSTLTFAGTTVVTGSFSGDIANTGNMTFNGGGDYESQFTNSGTVTVTGGILLGGGGTITNSTGATFTITDDSSFAPSSYEVNASGTFINEGTFTKSGGTGTSEFPLTTSTFTGGGEFENIGGTVNIDSGNFAIHASAALQGGLINVAAGSTLTFDCGDTTGSFPVTLAGTLTSTGGGTIALANGNFYPQAPGEVAADATLDFPSGMVQVGAATFSENDNTITNTGFLNFVGSTAHGAISMINQGTVTNSGSADLPLYNFVNDTTGILDLQTDAGLTNAGGGGLTNMGVIRKSAGTGVSVLTTGFFNDGGSLDIESGSLAFQEGNFGYIAGPIYIATGAALDFETTSGVYVQGTLSSTGGGIVNVISGWFDGPDANFGENANASASLDFAPNTLTMAGGFIDSDQSTNLVNTGTINFAAAGSGPLAQMYNSGTMNFAAGQFDVGKGSGITNLPGGVINFNGAVNFVTNAINCRIDNQGLIVVNAGNSTMDLATPYPYDGYVGAPALTNEGTIEVASGTLLYPSVSLTSGNAIPAGAGYTVDAGASLTTEVPTSITTNNGTVILKGPGAQFPAIAPLATNNGTFEVLSGATFATTGDLTNTGTLSVGGSLTVNGNFSQSASSSTPPVLDFPVAAAASSSAAPNLTVTGSTTLAGNLTAEYAGGFAAGAGSSYTVAHFASAATGSFASTTGVGPDFTVGVNPTSIVLNSTSQGTSDLDVTSVTAPAAFSAGQSATIDWHVTNQGTGSASGTWEDSVYLTTNGTIDASAIVLGRVDQTGPLAAGASYTGTLTASMPAVPVGTYKIVVLVDSMLQVAQTSRAGDIGVSSPLTNNIPVLTLGQTLSGTISAGQDLVFQLTVPGGNDVRVTATLSAALLTDLEISRGTVPEPGTAQFEVPLNPSSTILATTIPQPQPGTYYIHLHGQPGIGNAQPFTLGAASVSFAAYGVAPATVGAGSVSVTISGAGFADPSTVSLVGGSGNVIASATTATARDANTLLASFDLTGVPPAVYSLKITSNGKTTTLSNAVTVQATTASLAPVQFSLDAPSRLEWGYTYDLLVKYTNPNNVDVPAPIFELSQPNAEFELVSGNFGAKINPDTTFSAGAIELMAENQEGAAGVLPPNYTGLYDIRFTAISNLPDTSLSINLNTVTNGSTDLSSFIEPGPDGVSEVTAEILAAQVNGLSALPTDPTVGPSAYDAMPNLNVSNSALSNYLDAVATELSTAGLYTPNVTSLVSTAINSADDFGAVTQRQTAGPFGQGTPDPLLYEVIVPSTGQYVDVVMPGGSERFLDTGSTFTAADPVDTDTLTTQPDGTLRLTELDGSFYQFNSSDYLAYYQTAGGLRTTFNYDANHNVTSVVAPGNQTTTYTYNSNGLVISSTDPFGDVTTYGYTVSDSASLLTSITTPAGTTTITYTPTPALQSKTIVTYHSNGTRIQVPTTTVTSYYDSSPALSYLPTTITLPDGSGQTYTYDGFGRLSKTTLLDGSDPVTETYDATGLGVTTTFADGTTETDLYGPDGILLKTTNATGNTTSFNYGPNLLLSSILAPGGALSSLTYNGQNQFSGGVSPTGTAVTLTYDSEGRVIGLTNGNGNTVTVAYDSNSNLTSLTFPDGTQDQFAYNSAGELDQVTGRDGAVTSYTLNANGQPTQVSYSDGTSFSYTYDAHGNIVTSTDSDGTTTYTYNAAQEITSIAYPGGQSVSYQYDSHGRVTQESDQSGVLESYTYDADARLSEVLDGSGNLLVAYTYDDLDRVSMESFGNGTKTVYSYDADGNVASITNLAIGGTVSSSLTYTYNAQGEPLTSTDQSGNVTSYAYDALGQLTQVSLPGGRTIQYNYDADGNRTSVVDSAGTETAAYAVNNLDQYTTVGATSYTYDKDGNLQTMTNASGTTTYTYDPDGQLASSTGPAGTFTYSYNALEQLDSYTINGVRTNLLLDAAGNVIAAYNASGSLIANYQYGLGLISQQAPGGSSSFYDFDLTGNTTAITNSSGATVNTYTYLPFGEKLSSTGPSGNLFTYSGSSGVLDVGDGFYQTTYRTYSPVLGRFIQPDPTGYSGGDVNFYRYVLNSPLTAVDPTGLASGDPREELFQLLKSAGKKALSIGAEAAEDTLAEELADPLLVPLTEEVFLANAARVTVKQAAALASAAALEAFLGLGAKGQEVPNPWDDYLDWVIWFKYRYGIYKVPANGPGPEFWSFLFRVGDPNEIVGPAGEGGSRYVTANQPLSYTIFFQNEPTATAAVHVVTVTTTLDPNVDLATFRLQSIGWGSEVINVPPGLTSYSTRVSYVQPNTGKTVLVDVSAALDFRTRTLTWTFTTLDPTTLDAPSDPLEGFLPPDNSTGQGTGFVSYTVDPVAGLATGTMVSAAASIVFDHNAAISTQTWTNTIDTGPPSSTVAALAATQTTPSFLVSWSGHDDPNGSAIASYTVYVSIDGGAFTPWMNTTATSAEYEGSPGYTYAFYTIATDNAGNVQAFPTLIETTTTLVAPTLTIAGPSTATAGSTYTLNLSASGTGASAITSWTVNWGDGSVQTFPGDPTSVTHVYAKGPSTDTISATATNPAGTFAADDTVQVAVAASNAPGSALPAPWPAVAGVAFFDTGSFKSTAHGPFSAEVNYGDGTGWQVLRISESRTFTLDHVFASSGIYIVTVGVKEGGQRSAQFMTTVTVSPALASGYGAGRDAFVTTLYTEDLARTPEPQGLRFWSGVLAAKTKAKTVAVAIYDSSERRADLAKGDATSISFHASYADAIHAGRQAARAYKRTPSGPITLARSLRKSSRAAHRD